MKTILLLSALLSVTASAQSPAPNMPDRITCLYNANGKLTGTEAAAAGAKPGAAVQSASGGDRAWSYTIVGSDRGACPDKLPVSSNSQE
jgi:hypothetical protein